MIAEKDILRILVEEGVFNICFFTPEKIEKFVNFLGVACPKEISKNKDIDFLIDFCTIIRDPHDQNKMLQFLYNQEDNKDKINNINTLIHNYYKSKINNSNFFDVLWK